MEAWQSCQLLHPEFFEIATLIATLTKTMTLWTRGVDRRCMKQVRSERESDISSGQKQPIDMEYFRILLQS